MIHGMRGGYILPTMTVGESYHTRKHGVSVYKGLNLDKTKLIFVDKNKLIRLIDNTFEGLVQFLAVNRVTQLGVDTINQANGIGL
jgi:hypothetical protein